MPASIKTNLRPLPCQQSARLRQPALHPRRPRQPARTPRQRQKSSLHLGPLRPPDPLRRRSSDRRLRLRRTGETGSQILQSPLPAQHGRRPGVDRAATTHAQHPIRLWPKHLRLGRRTWPMKAATAKPLCDNAKKSVFHCRRL